MQPIKILFEDEFLLLAVKPNNLLSLPDASGAPNVVSALALQIGCPLFSVHRLDRGTGGVMVFAKTKEIAAKLSAAMGEGDFSKEYLAVVHGAPSEADGSMEDLLFKDSAKNKSYVVKRERRGVKNAKLTYQLRQTVNFKGKAVSLVSVWLQTGRTHQIRVQFSHRKMPLLGDGKYGSKDNGCTTALFSTKLTLTHPVIHQKITAEQLPPNVYPWNLFETPKEPRP